MFAKENFLDCSGYRLPTESEWEFAARAGADSSRHYGSTAVLLTEYAWYQANGNHHLHSVALLKPNDFGLFDMYGNAYEWCYDQYLGYPIDSDSDQPVADDPETLDVSNNQRRILRGGSFRNLPPTARSAARVADRPSSRVLNHGFRPVRTWK